MLVTGNGIERRIEFKLDELPSARCDASLLRQVWINLIDNALKFTSRNENTVIQIRYESNEDEHIYHVIDNGGSRESLRKQVAALHQKYLQFAGK